MANKFVNFLREMNIELKKVSWPSRNELIGSTTVVIISVALLAMVIGIWDFMLAQIIDLLIR